LPEASILEWCFHAETKKLASPVYERSEACLATYLMACVVPEVKIISCAEASLTCV